jgi:hypothetical protein
MPLTEQALLYSMTACPRGPVDVILRGSTETHYFTDT